MSFENNFTCRALITNIKHGNSENMNQSLKINYNTVNVMITLVNMHHFMSISLIVVSLGLKAVSSIPLILCQSHQSGQLELFLCLFQIVPGSFIQYLCSFCQTDIIQKCILKNVTQLTYRLHHRHRNRTDRFLPHVRKQRHPLPALEITLPNEVWQDHTLPV